MSRIDKQLIFYKKHQEELARKYPDKVLVISPDLEINAFDNPESGFDFGRNAYGYGNFMLKDCRKSIVSQLQIISPIYTVAD